MNQFINDFLDNGNTDKPQVVEHCPKCRGTGTFRSWAGRAVGPCHACKGTGRKTFANPADVRAKNRAKTAERKARRLASNVEEFKTREPAVWTWLDAAASRPKPFEFAVSLRDALNKYGDLTEGQLEACKRLVAKDAERAAQRAAEKAERDAAAPVVDASGTDRLHKAFDAAYAYAAARGRGLQYPKITIGDMVISPAPAHGKNPGALYVKATGGRDATYFGKITGGHFFAAQACDAERTSKVLAFVNDPMKAAEAYGQETGRCCLCDALLTNEVSIKRGIGPICAAKFGW